MLAERGMAQLHVAETEKYAHVTYFLNGGEEHPYEGEERRLVDSPRDVPTYDKKPEMSAGAATDAFVEAWRDGDFGFGIINFANSDMVGHTGVIPPPWRRSRPWTPASAGWWKRWRRDGVCVITADHGNADHMLARRQPQYGSLDEPRAAGDHRRCGRVARGRDPGRRGPHDPRAPGSRAPAGNDWNSLTKLDT